MIVLTQVLFLLCQTEDYLIISKVTVVFFPFDLLLMFVYYYLLSNNFKGAHRKPCRITNFV